MNNKLKQALEVWTVKKDYSRRAMPEVLAYNKQYREETGKYSYNSAIEEFILAREKIDADLIDMLGTEIYLSQHDIRNDEAEENKKKMLAGGYRVLDRSVIDEALEANKKLQVVATSDIDWLTVKIDRVYKPYIFNKGTDREQYGLMKPRARNRGYTLNQFNDAFCKLV